MRRKYMILEAKKSEDSAEQYFIPKIEEHTVLKSTKNESGWSKLEDTGWQAIDFWLSDMANHLAMGARVFHRGIVNLEITQCMKNNSK